MIGKNKIAKFAGKYSNVPFDGHIRSVVQEGYNPRETRKVESRGDSIGIAAAKPSMQYTGDKMLGISIIHKSCLQPIFTDEEAKAAASMRR